MRADVNSLELGSALEVSQLKDSSNSINSDIQSDKLPHTQSQSAHQSAQQHHLQQDVHPQRVTIYSILWRLHFKPMIPALTLYLFTAVTTALLPLLLRSVVRFAQASYRASHGMPPLPKYPHMHEYMALMSISFFEEYATLRCLAVGQKLRVQFASQTLAKIMRISPQHRSKMSMGSLINLVGSDSVLLMRGFGLLPTVAISLVQTLISFVVLHVFLGASALVGCALLVLYYPLQQWLAMRKYRMRKRLSAITDERVRLIREVIQGIRVVKCFTMETVIVERVAALRSNEMKLLRLIWMIDTGASTLLPLLMTMAGILTIATCCVPSTCYVPVFAGSIESAHTAD
ncbi:hypothetical protein GQ42DRAFT_154242 [Ramicandelaber brevisporus]|nr:hypothetical protein GQ42DRAFT_154242 [Ramicandelaber brevisporus]